MGELTIYDAHLHFADVARLEELHRYLERTGISGAALISLPYPGWVNFNPEVLRAKASDPERFRAFGAFDLEYGPAGRGAGRGAGSRAAGRSPGRVPGRKRDLTGQVREMASMGFDGIKVWAGKPAFQKRLGITPDGPEFTEAFAAAAQEGLPVLIHMADPEEFWASDRHDSRGWLGFDDYIEQAARVAEESPDTRFLFAHMLFLAGDIPKLSSFLEAHENAFLDIAPGNYFYRHISEQREAAADFFEACRGRLLFGTDGLFFSRRFESFPYTDEQAVFERFRRVCDFFLEGATVDNPFPLNRALVPSVTGPALSRSAKEELASGAFRALFTGVGIESGQTRSPANGAGSGQARGPGKESAHRPRPLNPEAVRRYLEEFPRRLSFSPEALERLVDSALGRKGEETARGEG